MGGEKWRSKSVGVAAKVSGMCLIVPQSIPLAFRNIGENMLMGSMHLVVRNSLPALRKGNCTLIDSSKMKKGDRVCLHWVGFPDTFATIRKIRADVDGVPIIDVDTDADSWCGEIYQICRERELSELEGGGT